MFSFSKGDVVIADRTTQGLKLNEHYVVVDLETQVSPFGYFVTYYLAPADEVDTAVATGSLLPIVNGHLILRGVSAEAGKRPNGTQ